MASIYTSTFHMSADQLSAVAKNQTQPLAVNSIPAPEPWHAPVFPAGSAASICDSRLEDVDLSFEISAEEASVNMRSPSALLISAFLALFALQPLDAPAGGIHTADDIVLAQAITTNVAPTKGRVSKSLFGPSTPKPGYGPQAFTWFWNEVSPARNAADAQRWSRVVGVIEGARRSGKPVFGSRAAVESILADYRAILEREAKLRNVSVALLVAVIAVESGGNPGAISPKGAGGLMQLMPDTARRFGVSNALAPAQSIRGGAHYLDWLLRFFGDDAVLALAGYNAGEQAVERNLGVPPYSETRDYVAKVAGAYWMARQLCETPPKGPREVCALK